VVAPSRQVRQALSKYDCRYSGACMVEDGYE
jgi:hypothetical protein